MHHLLYNACMWSLWTVALLRLNPISATISFTHGELALQSLQGSA